MFKLILYSVLSGFIIGLSGFLFVCTRWLCEYVIKINVLTEIFNIIGAFVFSCGLLIICTFKLYLFTGRVGDLFDVEYKQNKKILTLQLLLILVINVIASTAIGIISNLIFKKTYYIKTIQTIVNGRIVFTSLNEYISIFMQSILCGVCVTSAVKVFIFNPFFCSMFVAIFVYSNYQHSIANPFYFGADYNNFSYKMLINEILAIAGNTIGAIPIIILTNVIRKSIMNSTCSMNSTNSKTNDSTQEITSDDSSTSLV